MNTPEKNNYIQYVNKNGIVKAKNVVFNKGEQTTTFTVSGIDEEFFIFAIYENNIQRFCVGIENLENTDMLGFINSNMVDLSCIPEYAFLQPQTAVEFSYNNEYVENYKFGVALSGSGYSDSEDLKFLKSFLINYYGSLDDFAIEPYHICRNSTNTAIYIDPNCVFFGKFWAVDGVFNEARIEGFTSIKGANKGEFNIFGTAFFNNALEGSGNGMVLTGYKVYHPTYFA